MNRLDEIRQHCEGGGPIRRIDMKYLLSEVDRLNDGWKWALDTANANAKLFDEATARAEAAEARADALVKEVRRLRQEKQEREKGCEYCADHEDLAFGHDSMKRAGSIYIDGNLLVADLYSESMAVAVCFCPMCGKPLKGETHD